MSDFRGPRGPTTNYFRSFPYYGRSGPPRTPLQPKRNYSAYDPSEPEDAAYHSEAHRAQEAERAAIMWERGMALEGRAKRS